MAKKEIKEARDELELVKTLRRMKQPSKSVLLDAQRELLEDEGHKNINKVVKRTLEIVRLVTSLSEYDNRDRGEVVQLANVAVLKTIAYYKPPEDFNQRLVENIRYDIKNGLTSGYQYPKEPKAPKEI